VKLDEIDLGTLDLWDGPIDQRNAAFARLREERPIAFFEEPEPESDLMARGPGFWSVTRHRDVVEASRHADLFCSGQGTSILDMPPFLSEFLGSMINMDDPRHARLRRIVSKAFTPRTLAGLSGDVEAQAAEIVDAVAAQGECDFVTEVAALLPLRVIVDLMGIPRSQEREIFDCTNRLLGFLDPEYVPEQTAEAVMMAIMQAAQDLAAIVTELAEHRSQNPANDLITVLLDAEVDDDKLTHEELASFFILLVVAGNETTRNAIAHGLDAFTQHPDQLARWQADFEGLAPTAVEEIVRWSSPVQHFRRTVTRDGVRLGDHEFDEGDKVVLWYGSANRDAAVFDDPDGFDIGRTPNDHVGFGGPGPHFCLGAHLARREITVVYRELFRRLPDIHAVGPPDRLRSNFINGIKHLPVAFTPTA
jgi:cytochrome P450